MAAIIDIHCHTFNADDLPVKGFVRRVGGAKTALAKLIAGVIDDKVQGYAPGFKQELEEIAKRLDPAAASLEGASFEPNLADEADTIFEELRQQDAELVSEAEAELLSEQGAPSGEEALEGVFDRAADLKRWIMWALLFAKARIRLTEIVATTYDEVDLFTPMLVDLQPGVDDPAETSIHDQLEMQSEISKVSMLGKLRGAPDTRVHPFVGFDPRRPGAVDLVWEAVRDFGFVGVKMYPPMGFRPLGNVHTPLPSGMDGGQATAADAALRQLYELCVTQDVPITAHSNATNFADADYERFSSPHNWRMVLAEFPDLHLNLGHFGGSGTGDHPDWPQQIAALANAYPSLYADIGNHGPEGIDDYMTLLQELFSTKATSDMRGRLMFGTDWFMVANHRGFEGFLTTFRNKFDKSFPNDRFPGAVDNFMGGAARRFLGFDDPQNKNAQRVAARYQELGAQVPDWLATP